MLLLVRLYQQCAAASKKQRQNRSLFFHAYIDIKGHETLLFSSEQHKSFEENSLKRNCLWRKLKYGHCCPVYATVLFLFLVVVRTAMAQDNYEIQVYGSDTVAPKNTMLELHSNFTVNGSKPLAGSQYTADDTYPTNHAEHETVEITQGLTSWSEVGFYIFTSERSGQGIQWVGDHIRP